MEIFSYISLVPNILFILLFSVIPESPQHYIMRMNMIEAEKSLQWLRRKNDVKKELQELQEYTQTSSKMTLLQSVREFKLPGNFTKKKKKKISFF